MLLLSFSGKYLRRRQHDPLACQNHASSMIAGICTDLWLALNLYAYSIFRSLETFPLAIFSCSSLLTGNFFRNSTAGRIGLNG